MIMIRLSKSVVGKAESEAVAHVIEDIGYLGMGAVVGEFENGDIVCLTNRETRKRILSMVEMSSNDIKKYKGYHSQEIYEIADKVFSTVISRAHFREYTKKKNYWRRVRRR